MKNITRGLVVVVLMFAGCSGGEPFDYIKTSGKVTYEDGSLIPSERVVVTFLSQNGPRDSGAHPRPGIAEVDVKTGAFDCVTSHNYGDGIVPGKHKVTVRPLGARSAGAVPTAYTAVQTTPLEVDADNGPFEFRIPKR
ncbi:MAG: hypothetical protein JXM70_02810 [Pirellulales bacterium]|nr:hypothetical protein [Pirellulales bacterium]